MEGCYLGLLFLVVVILDDTCSAKRAVSTDNCGGFSQPTKYMESKCVVRIPYRLLELGHWFHCSFHCVWISKACASTALVTVKHHHDLRFVEKRDAHRSDGLFFSLLPILTSNETVFFQSAGHRPLLVHCDSVNTGLHWLAVKDLSFVYRFGVNTGLYWLWEIGSVRTEASIDSQW